MFVKRLEEISQADAAFAGGKGASLGEMLRAGLPVPSGLLVVTAAFEFFIKAARLTDKIYSAVTELNIRDAQELERGARHLRALILRSKVPSELTREILQEFKRRNYGFVAVRSSAIFEDSRSASWAGEFDTLLNVSEPDLVSAVQKCWASLYTPAAITHHLSKKRTDRPFSMAVVIQNMVESHVSGICFTTNPVTKDNAEIVIQAGFGLGQAIVSGVITPDTYVIQKSSRQIRDVSVEQQQYALTRSVAGNILKKLPRRIGGKQKLSAAQIIELVSICTRIEELNGCPQDIEWALEYNNFYILQARAVTTL